MRPTVVMKNVLVLVLLSGGAVCHSQAANFINDYNRMSNSCDALKVQLGTVLDESSTNEILAFGNGLGVPALLTDIYFDGVESAQFSRVTHSTGSTESVNVSSSDGLMASVSNDHAIVDLNGQETAATSSSNQPKVVPVSAVAWLFSSALFGFVVMANRRKV
ncbi:hypothetical protein [Pseudomonas sp. NFX15]|uniref:hypothetical protein n=1 Tax=Pseudomonas sp. NFX15 TaxID=2816958 RepID=UPI003B8C892B